MSWAQGTDPQERGCPGRGRWLDHLLEPRHHNPGNHPPPPSSKPTRMATPGCDQRQRGVRPGDPATHVSPDHWLAGTFQRPGDRSTPGMPEEIVAAGRAELNPTDLRLKTCWMKSTPTRSGTPGHARLRDRLALKPKACVRAGRAPGVARRRSAGRYLNRARLEALGELKKMRDELGELRRQMTAARQPLDVLENLERL